MVIFCEASVSAQSSTSMGVLRSASLLLGIRGKALDVESSTQGRQGVAVMWRFVSGPGALCVGPPSLSASGPGALRVGRGPGLSVSGPGALCRGALCVRPQRSLCRARRSLCRGPALCVATHPVRSDPCATNLARRVPLFQERTPNLTVGG